MFSGENPAAIIGQTLVAVVLITSAGYLAWLDPTLRAQIAGALILGVGSVTGFFFSQRATAASAVIITNGMSHLAGMVASAVPGPTGATGTTGATGATGAPAPPIA